LVITIFEQEIHYLGVVFKPFIFLIEQRNYFQQIFFASHGGCNPDSLKNIDKPRSGYLEVVYSEPRSGYLEVDCGEYLNQEVITLRLFHVCSEYLSQEVTTLRLLVASI
jgi:hypothetical protein